MIVVDANVVAYLHLPTEHTRHAEYLFESDPEWAAPTLWRSEFRSILTRYLRRGVLSFDQAYAIQRAAEEMLSATEYDVDSLAVLRLVQESECSSYDCEYVALAVALETRLATMDKQILRSFPKVAQSLMSA